MSSVQKIIKYLAIALAVFLIFNIVSGVMYGVIALGSVFSGDNEKTGLDEIKVNSNIDTLDIELASVNITIKKGNRFKLETNSKEINYREVDNKLFITDDKNNWFNRDATSDLIIYLSDDYIMDEILIENGAGRLEIEELGTRELELDLGAGSVVIDKLNVITEASINSGAGEMEITDSSINNLDLDIGIGKVVISSKLMGSNELDAGIGEVELNLLGNRDDYKINVDKGIGEVNIDGDSVSSSTYYGNGDVSVDIDGGIGSIDINLE